MYLHKILQRSEEHWTRKMLLHLQTLNIGWAKIINEKLNEYELEQDWNQIKTLSKSRWKSIVCVAVRAKNRLKLLDSCIQQGSEKIKTKTAYVYNKISNDANCHEILPEILLLNRVDTKTVIVARSGMLECGKNFKGTLPEICRECGEEDSESHRLNRCVIWRHLNYLETVNEVEFDDIYNSEKAKLSQIIPCIQRIWEIHNGNGTMKKQLQ